MSTQGVSLDIPTPGMEEVEGRSFHQLQKLNDFHINLAELVLDGFTEPEELAKMLGRSPTGIRNILATGLFRDHLARRREERNKRNDQANLEVRARAMKILEDAQVEAAETQVDLMRCKADPRVQQNAVSEIFDILGWKDKKGNDETTQVKVSLGPGAMLNLQVALNQSNAQDRKNGTSGETLPQPVEGSVVE